MYMDMANSLAHQSILFTNQIIEGSRHNSNRSCVPIADGTRLDRGYASLPTATMGDHSRSAELDENQQPAEVGERQAVQGSSDTDSATDRLVINEDGEGPHPYCAEVTSNPIRE